MMELNNSEALLAVLQAVPGNHLILVPDAPHYTIVAVTDEYLRTTFATREGVLYHSIFDVFPHNPELPHAWGIKNLSESLQNVIKHRAAHQMPLERYHVVNLEIPGLQYKVWQLINKPVLDAQGEIQFIIHTVQDVTIMESSSYQLREEHRRLIDAQAIGLIGSFEWNLGEKAVVWSDEMFRINGMEPQSEVITIERTNELVHPEDLAEVLQLKETSFSTPDHYRLQHRIVLDNGTVKWVAHRFESLADNAGNIVRVHGTLQDITDLKKVEEDLIQTKEQVAQNATNKYQTLFNSIDEGFCLLEIIFNDEGKAIDYLFLDINYAFEKQSGVKNALGKTALQLAPDLEPLWMDAVGEVVSQGLPLRFENFVSPLKKWFDVHLFPIGDPGYARVAGLFNDITERKKVEDQQAYLLKFSDTIRAEPNVNAIGNRSLQMLTEQLRLDRCYVGVYKLADNRGEFPYQVGNDRVLPLPASVRLSDFPHALQIAFDRTLVIDDVAKAEGLTSIDRQNLDALGLCAFVAATLRRGENNPLWSIVAVSASPRHWTPGEITLIEEVTERTWAAIERIKAEEDLRISEEMYRQQLEKDVEHRSKELQENRELLQTAFDTTVTGLAIFNAVRDKAKGILDFEFQFMNKVAIKYYGGDLKGKRYTELPPSIKQASVFDRYVKTVEQDEPQDFELHYELEGYANWYRIITLKLGDGLLMSYENITGRKKAEADRLNHITLLHQSEALASIGSWEYDITTGKFTWSEGMYSLFELEPEREVTPEIYLQLAVEEHKQLAEQVVKGIKGEAMPLDETLCLKINGQERILKIKTTVITDDAGKPLRSLGVDMDVTATQKAQAQLKEQAHFIQNTNEALQDILYVMNIDTKKIIYINHPFQQKLGYTFEQGKKMSNPFFDTLYEEDLPLILLHIEAMWNAADGEVREIEYRRKDGRGALHWFRDRNSVFRRDAIGNVVEKVGITQDITESRKAGQQLKDANIILRYANENLQQFASIASHDLQEPLRKLRLFVSVLKRFNQDLPTEAKELIGKISATSDRMSQLIREVLQYSKIAYGLKEFVPTNLDAILQNVFGDLDLLKKETKAIIEYKQTLPEIDAIPPQMNQLFYNLLVNALKFRKDGVQPVVKISYQLLTSDQSDKHPELKEDRTYLEIRFSDNGIGFEQQYAKQIFEIFERLHSVDEYEGTGVGLALCKKIVENHSGHIYAVSGEGEGARFFILLPVKQ